VRQIVLDTETTGLDAAEGHRVIEIGCVELVNRRLTNNRYHEFLQPDREIDRGAMEVHGITNEQLVDKPRFADVVKDFMDFVDGAELIIHNAPFDVGFLNHELGLLGDDWGPMDRYCSITDTLHLARQIHPGQKNTLDALCKRYNIDNSQRDLHGALLDAELLADVYLAMTGGQASLSLDGAAETVGVPLHKSIRRIAAERPRLAVIPASTDELDAHRRRLEAIDKASGGSCIWRKLDGS